MPLTGMHPTDAERRPSRRTPLKRATRFRSASTALVAVSTSFIIVASGVIIGHHLARSSERATTNQVPSTILSTLPITPVPEATSSAPSPPQLEADFKELQATIDGVIGVAISPAGRDQKPILLGEWSSGPAWSTMKVPLAMAALRQSDYSGVTNEMKAAITQSDNAAAESMWEALGDPKTAAQAVEAILRGSGDPTLVQDQKVRPEYTAFGQTDWSLTDQVHFLAATVCDDRYSPIFGLMGEVESDQTWGIGQVLGAKFKGGWGPYPSGGYLVRQIGVLTSPRGTTAVAPAAQPASGSFADGKQDLTKIAEWLRDHEAMLPAAQCG